MERKNIKSKKNKSISKSKNITNKNKRKTKSPKKSPKKAASLTKNKSLNKKSKNKSKSTKKKSKSKKKKNISKVKLSESETKNKEDITNNEINNANNNVTEKEKTQLNISEPVPSIPENPKKIFVDSKVGTPHLDITKYIKVEIVKKEKLINKLYNIKDIYSQKLKNTFEKLENTLKEFRQSPEQIEKIRLLYFILKINKKNNNDSILKNKTLKEEYKILLHRNNYDPIEKINKYRTKIDKSKNENIDMLSQINELRNNHIKKRNKLKLFALNDKYNFDIKNLTTELNMLNNEKQKAINRLKTSKKIINNIVIKFKDLIQTYELYKNNFCNIKRVDKDIKILEKDLYGDEQEIFNKIMDDKMLIMKEISYNYKFKMNDFIKINYFKNDKDNRESIDKINIKKIKNIKRSESAKSMKVSNSCCYNNKKNMISLRKQFFYISELPLININTKNINNKDNQILNYNDNSSIDLLNNEKGKEKLFLEDLNISKFNDIDYDEINNKKAHYNKIIKKLDYSIKEVENMYKRKIVLRQDDLYENIKKIEKMGSINDTLKKEIENLSKILNSQKNYDLVIFQINKEIKINELKKKYENIEIKKDNIYKDDLTNKK